MALLYDRHSTAYYTASYGVLELLIGVSGLVVAPLLRTGRTLLSASAASWDSPGYYIACGAWIGLVMLPFCGCMGATFPLAMAATRKSFGIRSRDSFSYLYLANVLGATTGAVGSAFFLIELLGFSGTLLVPVALNFCVAAFSYVPGGSVAETGRAGLGGMGPGHGRGEPIQNCSRSRARHSSSRP